MNSDKFLTTLGLVDLISEKHKQLRQKTMQRIENQFVAAFSEMDIYLISLVGFEPISVSESARYMNVSRQAAHKHVKYLASLGFVDLATSPTNRRKKIITLTESGKQLGEQVNAIKAGVELELKERLGGEYYSLMTSLLKDDWLIPRSLPTTKS